MHVKQLTTIAKREKKEKEIGLLQITYLNKYKECHISS